MPDIGVDPAAFLTKSAGTSSEGPLLSTHGLSVHFGGVQAIEGIDLVLSSSELVAVVGPNGAGKTTLLNAISGLAWATAAGEIVLDGHSLVGRHPAAIASLGVARSFQNPPLIEDETVLQNVLVGAHLRLRYRMVDQVCRPWRVRAEERTERDRAYAVLEFTGLLSQAQSFVNSLPYGARKLVDIARALMMGSRLLLLDEPTSGLDLQERRVVQELLIALRRSTQLSILVVEHHMEVVRATADRVIGMQAGTILRTGTPPEVLDSEAFRAAVIGRSATTTSHRSSQ